MPPPSAPWTSVLQPPHWPHEAPQALLRCVSVSSRPPAHPSPAVGSLSQARRDGLPAYGRWNLQNRYRAKAVGVRAIWFHLGTKLLARQTFDGRRRSATAIASSVTADGHAVVSLASLVGHVSVPLYQLRHCPPASVRVAVKHVVLAPCLLWFPRVHPCSCWPQPSDPCLSASSIVQTSEGVNHQQGPTHRIQLYLLASSPLRASPPFPSHLALHRPSWDERRQLSKLLGEVT